MKGFPNSIPPVLEWTTSPAETPPDKRSCRCLKCGHVLRASNAAIMNHGRWKGCYTTTARPKPKKRLSTPTTDIRTRNYERRTADGAIHLYELPRAVRDAVTARLAVWEL